MSAATKAGAQDSAQVEYSEHRLGFETGMLVTINGRPAGWIFKNGRTGTCDFTLTDLGEATTDIESAYREDCVYAGDVYRVYKQGLSNVAALDVLKARIEELANR